MINKNLIHIFSLATVNVIKQISEIELKKKNYYILKDSKFINFYAIKIGMRGNINIDVIIDFSKNFANSIFKNFLSSYSGDISIGTPEEKEMFESVLSEIGNMIVSKISAYLYKVNYKVNVTYPVIFDKTKVNEINYENIIVIEFGSNTGQMELCIGINELKSIKTVNLVFYGLTETIIDYLTSRLIPIGIEISSINDESSLKKLLKTKKIDFLFMDFYKIAENPQKSLRNLFKTSIKKVNLILGINKIDLPKVKQISAVGDNYQIVGLYPKTYSPEQLIHYIYSILKKVGIAPDERRKHIRVNVPEQNKFYVSFMLDNHLVKAKIINISLGGIRCLIEDHNDIYLLKVGQTINSVELFLKYKRLFVDCIVVYIKDDVFALNFVNLTEEDINIISKVIFKILSAID